MLLRIEKNSPIVLELSRAEILIQTQHIRAPRTVQLRRYSVAQSQDY